MTLRFLGVSSVALLLAACASPTIKEPSKQHFRAEDVPAASNNLPQPVAQPISLPKPKASARTETYSVVVNGVRVHELLFALARDARLNVDIHPGINGIVTLNAIDQTLPQLLSRIARQVDMRFELDGPNLTVMPDTPFLRNYPIDYVNMTRDTTGTVAVTTQLVGAGAGGAAGASGAASAGNNSTTRIENKAQHHFWETLVQNIKDILRETDKEIVVSRRSSASQTEASKQGSTSASASGTGGVASAASAIAQAVAGSGNQAARSQAENQQRAQEDKDFKEYQTVLAASVIAHPETGILTVRATGRQHEKIQEFLDRVQTSARRQVMIEAMIAEVQLSNQYQQGIDWSRLLTSAAGFSIKLLGNSISTTTALVSGTGGSYLELGYKNTGQNFTSSVKLLDAFGTVKVLSSPKLSVLNNQTAVLKVVDNSVYFTVKADTTQNQTTTVTTYTTTLNQVPVGFVMNITPQISDNDQVILNVRPSISRIVDRVADPNPALKDKNIESFIPVIRTREMESVLRIQNGNIAVMGGLMEDSLQNTDSSVPGISRIPLVGELFTQRNDFVKKTELVIFLRPIVIRDASLSGDYSSMRDTLPKQDFFTNIPDPQTPGDKVQVIRGAQ